MKAVDVHTHILHGVDDGPKESAVSLKMVEGLLRQDIHAACMTPHFYPYAEELEKFLARRNQAFDALKEELNGKFKIYNGAEVCLDETLFQYEDISALCIGKSSYLLVEFADDRNTSKCISMLYKLIANYSVTPIVAHVERYPHLFKREYLISMCCAGCFIQFDNSALKKFFLRHKIAKYVNMGLIHLAASDCHDLQHFKPDFDVLRKYFSFELCDRLTTLDI